MMWKYIGIFLAVLRAELKVRAEIVTHHFFDGNVAEDEPKTKLGSSVVKEWRTNIVNEPVTVTLSKHAHDKYELYMDFPRPCDFDSKIKVSTANHTELISKHFMGPDEILIHIEGKELLSYIAKYVSCGKYRNNFHLYQSGAYHLKIVHLRGNFSALNEYSLQFPPPHYQYLVNEWIELSGSQHKGATCHKSNYGAWLEKSVLVKNTSLYDTLATAAAIKPILHSGGDDRGMFESPLTSPIAIDSTHSSKGCVSTLDSYSYEPITGCKWLHVTPLEASKLLAGKKIALAGDSHMRFFGNILLEYACKQSPGSAFQKAKYTTVSIKSTEEYCAGLDISYSPNYNCDAQAFNWKPYKVEDFILFNCGHHPASAEHMPYDTYRYARCICVVCGIFV